jgi:hypothetical protein
VFLIVFATGAGSVFSGAARSAGFSSKQNAAHSHTDGILKGVVDIIMCALDSLGGEDWDDHPAKAAVLILPTIIGKGAQCRYNTLVRGADPLGVLRRRLLQRQFCLSHIGIPKELASIAAEADRQVRDKEMVTLPLVCAYGTERLWYESPQRKKSSKKENPQAVAVTLRRV